MNRLTPKSTMPSSPARICIITETYRPEINGVANTLGYLVDGLINKGHTITVVRPSQNKTDKSWRSGRLSQYTTSGCPIPRYGDLRFGLATPDFFKRLWKKKRPDAIYIATQGPLGWSARSAANTMGINVVSGFHTNFQSYSHYYGFGAFERLITSYLRYFHNGTQRTLVPTSTQVKNLKRLGFNNVKQLSRGVDCEHYHPDRRSQQQRQQWGATAESPVCLYVGRLAHEKNVKLLIRAYRHMQQVDPKIRFVFVGDGPARPLLEAHCPRAHFAGTKTGFALAEHYASADIFMFPSKTDTFGNVVTEAMASGLCVVAFDDAAAHELLDNNASGFIVNVNYEEHFIDALAYAATNPGLLTSIQEKSRLVAQSVSWSTITEQFERYVFQDHPAYLPKGNRYGTNQELSAR